MKDEWKQLVVEHCPKNCKGMLLQNAFRSYHKCSNCGCCFYELTTFEEVKEEDTIEYKKLGDIK
jgi:hypothetical protein